MEHKIDTLVAAPAAVEEALASLIVDHQDPALQYRALLTYVKRVYHPFLMRQPQVRWGVGCVFCLFVRACLSLCVCVCEREREGGKEFVFVLMCVFVCARC